MPRQIGLSDAEKAAARKISTTPSQSASSNAPKDMLIVSVCEPVGDKGEKKITERLPHDSTDPTEP